jgi:putative ATPase
VLGHGRGYRYPHDDPRGWLEQQYLPDDLSAQRYYEPSEHGAEQEVARRMSERRSDDRAGHDTSRP